MALDFSVGIVSGGVACRVNEPPFACPSLQSLSRDTLWMLDQSPRAFHLDASRPEGVRFVHGEFLGEPLSLIASRAGIRCTESTLGALAGIFYRTILAATEHFDFRPSIDDRVPYTLSDWLQSSLIDLDRFELRQSGSEILMGNVFKTIINAPTVPAGAASADGMIFLNGIAHHDLCERIQSISVPCGQWRMFPGSHFGNSVRAQVDTLRFLESPALIYGLVADVYEELAPVTQQSLRAGARRWMTQEEFVFLTTFGMVVPEKVYVCERLVKHASVIRPAMAPLSGICRTSLSHGLAFLNALQALSSPVIIDEFYLATSRAAWVASHFRLRTLRCFMRGPMARAGASLLGYGVSHARWNVLPHAQFRAMSSSMDIDGFDALAAEPRDPKVAS